MEEDLTCLKVPFVRKKVPTAKSGMVMREEKTRSQEMMLTQVSATTLFPITSISGGLKKVMFKTKILCKHKKTKFAHHKQH